MTAGFPETTGSQRGPNAARVMPGTGTEVVNGDRDVVYAKSFRASAAQFAGAAPTAELLEPGDVVVFDNVVPGQLRRGGMANDPAVAGCIVEDAGVLLGSNREEVDGTAALATSGLVTCKADATYGSIRVGDLLTLSATPGHAMRAGTAAPGTILGKAVEPLEEGTGLIKVLVMLR